MFNDDLEILDVVNDNDEVIGTIARSDMMSLKNTPGRYLRSVDVFIQRPNGDICLPRRSLHKKIAPGGLDASASGHILSGETYEQACIREIKEETGIDVTMEDLVPIATIKPSSVLFYFRRLYLLRTSQEPQLSPEHTEIVWVAPGKLQDVVHNDAPTKQTLDDDIPALINFLRNERTSE